MNLDHFKGFIIVTMLGLALSWKYSATESRVYHTVNICVWMGGGACRCSSNIYKKKKNMHSESY